VHSHELLDSVAAIVLVVGGLVFVSASILAYRPRDTTVRAGAPARRDDQASPPMSTGRSLLVIAATLLFGAALIHVAAVPPHLEEFAPFGYAFAALAVAQFVLAFALLLAWPYARSISVLLSIGVIAVWVMSRTTGLPIGVEPWVPENVGVADVISGIFEVALVAILVFQAARQDWFGSRLGRTASSIYLALVPITGVITLVTLIAVAALAGKSSGHMAGM